MGGSLMETTKLPPLTIHEEKAFLRMPCHEFTTIGAPCHSLFLSACSGSVDRWAPRL